MSGMWVAPYLHIVELTFIAAPDRIEQAVTISKNTHGLVCVVHTRYKTNFLSKAYCQTNQFIWLLTTFKYRVSSLLSPELNIDVVVFGIVLGLLDALLRKRDGGSIKVVAQGNVGD